MSTNECADGRMMLKKHKLFKLMRLKLINLLLLLKVLFMAEVKLEISKISLSIESLKERIVALGRLL